MTEEDLEAVERAVGGPHPLKVVRDDRGVIFAVAVIVVAIVVAMAIPLVFLLGSRNDARHDAREAKATAEQLRCETDQRAARSTEQAAAVAQILDSFAQLLLSGTRGQPPSSAIPAIEAAQRRLSAAVGDRAAPTTCPPAD